jgi:predicted RNase H-like nuclease (RuvC/YqgF family)
MGDWKATAMEYAAALEAQTQKAERLQAEVGRLVRVGHEDTERYQRRVQALEGHLDASIAREDNLQRANAGLQKRLAELESARDEARRIARRVRDLAWEWDLDAASATKLRNLEEETPWIRGGEQFHPTEEGLADE